MRTRGIVALLVLGSAMGSALAADNQVIGTVRATIDGQASTWYLLQPPGEVPPTALWVALGPDRGAASLAAYPSPDLELVVDTSTGATVPAGDTAVLLVSFAFAVDAAEQRHELPVQGGQGPAAVVYLEDWRNALGQFSSTDDPGEIHATVIDARRDGPSRFEGTFHGTLRALSGETLSVTDGAFTTDSARFHQ